MKRDPLQVRLYEVRLALALRATFDTREAAALRALIERNKRLGLS